MLDNKKSGRRTKRPDVDVLDALYQHHTAQEIAVQYGVTIHTVRGWLKYYRRQIKPDVRKDGDCT